VCNDLDDFFHRVNDGDDSDYYDTDLSDAEDAKGGSASSTSDDASADEYDAIRRFHVRPVAAPPRRAHQAVRGKYAIDMSLLPDRLARSFEKAHRYFTDELSTVRSESKGPVTKVCCCIE
jgi:hypothetical protein